MASDVRLLRDKRKLSLGNTKETASKQYVTETVTLSKQEYDTLMSKVIYLEVQKDTYERLLLEYKVGEEKKGSELSEAKREIDRLKMEFEKSKPWWKKLIG